MIRRWAAVKTLLLAASILLALNQRTPRQIVENLAELQLDKAALQ